MPLTRTPLARQSPSTTRAATPPKQQAHRRRQARPGAAARHQAPARRRRRQAATALLTVVLLLLALLAAAFGAAWYVSGRLIAITHVRDSYPLRVLAVAPSGGVVVLTRGPDATEPGSFRLAWRDGHATVGAVLASSRATVRRRVWGIHGRLAAGEQVGIEPDLYTGNPLTALHLDYATVSVPTPLGAMPAWYLPGRRTTWAILIHGLGGSRADTLPAIPTLHKLGYPMLAISYRNDIGAPRSPDDHSHLGATEWRDVAAAVSYALAHHATGVVLYGYSLGGSMALTVARDPHIRPTIRAVVLDSPLLDWPATLDYAAQRDGIPEPFAALTEAVLAYRAHIDYAQFDQLEHEQQLQTPILLFQGTDDTVLPPELAAEFARKRPDLVTYLPVVGADHVSAIDTAPSIYKAALERFLAALP
jgi:alpha-beta hydrolase superfamily lysophospholipase